jgi:hypothetical protein
MQKHIRLKARRGAALAALLVLSATALAAFSAAAPALRPRTTPANAEAQAAAARQFENESAVARHDAMISRMVARHDVAGSGAAGPTILARGRLHEPLALTAHGALAVAAFAAIAAIVLVSLAVVLGTRREDARRREAQARARAVEAQTRGPIAPERFAG